MALSTYEHYIDGVFVAGAEHLPVFNPATGEQLAFAPVAGAVDIDRAIEAARRASRPGHGCLPSSGQRICGGLPRRFVVMPSVWCKYGLYEYLRTQAVYLQS